jgi:hypothetical protein
MVTTPIAEPAEAPAPAPQPEPAAEEQAAEAFTTPVEAPAAEEQEAPLTLVPAVSPRVALAFASMPAADAPALVTQEAPALSYKPPFKLATTRSWIVSSDGGKTNTEAGTLVLFGCPVDLRLEISKATWAPNEHDWRLRFQFMDREGFLSEVNVNALSPKWGEPTVKVLTGTARSLLGALMMASHSEDDMEAVCRLVRLTLKQGDTRGIFIDLDVVGDNEEGEAGWIQLSGAKATLLVDQGPYGLVRAVTEVKRRFRAAGYLANTPAVIGEIPSDGEQPTVVPVEVVPELS